MNTENTASVQGTYREDGKTMLYTYLETPSEWIDEAGMPSGAFQDLATQIANEVAQGREHPFIQIGFCYHHKGLPYAALARTHRYDRYDGLSIRVNFNGGVAEVTPSKLTVMEFDGTRDVDTMLEHPSKFEYERVRESLTKDPVWRLAKATSRVTRKYDPATGLSLTESLHPAHGVAVNMSAYRPVTKVAAVQQLMRLLRRTPYAWENRNHRYIADIRLFTVNGLRSNGRFDKETVSPMVAEDVGMYDGLIDSIADVGDSAERYYRTLARLAQFAHATLPTICSSHVLNNLWRQTLSVPFFERFGVTVVESLKPTFGVEFARNYALALQCFSERLADDEEYTAEGYEADRMRLIELLGCKQ